MFTYTLAQYVAHKTNVAQQFTPQKHYRLSPPGQGILGPAPAIYASQPTTLPIAFSIMPPQDPTWQMDTRASSHLNFNASNLSTIFDKRLFPSVHVGDGKSIPVTNTDHNIIPSHHRPLHLHNVLGSQVAYLLLYVDDIILTASSTTLLQQLIDSLHREFDMTNLGVLNYFLGIPVVHHSTGLFLSQRKYALQLLERAHMVNCNPSRTPVDTESKLGPDGVPVQDPTMYRSLTGGLQYLTFTRPHLSYAGTLDLGLHLYASYTTSLVGYTDVDLAGCPSTRRSTSETSWLRNLLRELHFPLSTATLVYCDNISAVYMSANPVQHQRTKHIEIDIHFVRDMVTAGQVRVLHVPSRYQYADIFTKGLPSTLFEEFRSRLSVRPPFAPTTRAY
ncbi:ribonuclease H-like domain-containing protein [Tanacetum coccineum]